MSSYSPRVTILKYQRPDPYGPIPARSFQRQMAFLHAARYHILSLRELVTGLEGRASIPNRAVHLTFDDATADFAGQAWPVMRRYGFPASVFLVSDCIGKSAEWLGKNVGEAVPLMDAETILRLQSEGVRFGSHTRTHAHLISLDPERLNDEVTTSRTALTQLLGRDVFAFCYPYGEVNRAVLRAVGNAGYRLGFTGERNRATRGTHPLILPRHAVSFGTGIAGLFWKLALQPGGKPLELT